MSCKAPGSGKRIKDLKLTPVNMTRLQVLVVLLLDVPQITLQILLCVVLGEVSVTSIFSFVMTFLQITLGPIVAWKQMASEDKHWLRLMITKKAANMWLGGNNKVEQQKNGELPMGTKQAPSIPQKLSETRLAGVVRDAMHVVEAQPQQQADIDDPLEAVSGSPRSESPDPENARDPSEVVYDLASEDD